MKKNYPHRIKWNLIYFWWDHKTKITRHKCLIKGHDWKHYYGVVINCAWCDKYKEISVEEALKITNNTSNGEA